VNEPLPTEDLALESLVGRIADEFTERLKRGEQPDVEEYAQRYPQVATLLRQVLPALQAVGAPAFTSAAPGKAAANSPFLAGRLGDYHLVREIGRGGMGVVYEAEQVSLGRRVALKVLPFAAALEPKRLQRFKNEAQAAACLHHQNIVPVYMVGCDAGIHYFAMQFIEGRTLADLVAEWRQEVRRPLEQTRPADASPQLVPAHTDLYTPTGAVEDPPTAAPTEPIAGVAFSTERSARDPAFFRTAVGLAVQAAEALEHAHQLGVVHRDIKPANLMVDVRGNLWIADFGLALVQSDAKLTLTGDLVGTLRYMSPEQVLAGHAPLDHRTDIYSLGVTLYEVLALEPAFPETNRHVLLRQIAQDEPRPPRRINAAIPPELETIILKAMAKNPGERYATARELADDLRRFLDDKPIWAKRPTLWQRARKWTRRHKQVVVTAAVAGVLLLVLGVLGLAIGIARVTAEANAKEQALNDKVDEEKKGKEAEKQRADEEKKGREAEKQRAEALLGWRASANYRQIALAFSEYRANSVARANEMLDAEDKCPKDLHGWEWHYLKRLCHGELSVTPLDAPEKYRLIALSADGRRAALLDATAAVNLVANMRVCDTATGKEVLSFPVKGHYANGLAISADGKWLATCGNDNPGTETSVRVWNALTGEEAAVLKGADRWGYEKPASPGVYSGLSCLLLQSSVGEQMLAPAGGGLALGVQLGFDYQVARLDLLYLWPGEMRDVAFSPDGELVAAPDEKGRLQVWERATGKMLFRRDAHPMLGKFSNEVWRTRPVFSPDGKLVATACSDDATFKLWDARTGDVVRSLWQGPLDKEEGFSGAAFSPKGKWIAAAGRHHTRFPDPTVRVWEVGPNRARYVFRGTKVFTCLAFSPDEELLAAGNADDTLTIWDLATGREVAVYRGHENGVAAVAFREDGRVVSLDGTRTVRTWDPTRGPEYRTFRTWGGPHAALSSDGRRVAAAASQLDPANPTNKGFHTFVWDAETGRMLMKYEEHTGSPKMVAFSPDGKLVASAVSTGIANGVVRVFDVGTGAIVRNLPDQGPAALGPAHVVAEGFAAQASAAASGPLGALTQSLAAVPVMKLDAFTARAAPCDAVAWSPDGKLIASGGQDRVVRLWDAATGAQLQALGGHSRTVSALAFSRDGKRLASASGGITRHAPILQPNPLKLPDDSPTDVPDVKIWDVATGKELHSFSFPGKGPGMALSPDGEILAVTFGKTGVDINLSFFAGGGAKVTTMTTAEHRPDVVRLYRVATGEEAAVLKGHTRPPWCVAFSPDGLRVVTGGGADETVKLWDAKTGEEIMTRGRHPGGIIGVSFSPDGQKIVSIGDDEDVRVWDATPVRK
jgi:WD40 repeat protein/serine/threonine protein kinase